jgi:NitT/TauT family transport system substrate-binding protein
MNRLQRSVVRSMRSAAAFIVLGAVLAACSSSASTSPSPSGPAAASPVSTPDASGPAESGQAITLPAPEKTSVKIATSALEANTFVAWFAHDQGLYEKYGLDSEVLFAEGAQAEQALLAGQVDAIRGSLESAFFSQRTDMPLVVVAAFYNKFLDDFVTAADVASAEDLRGKAVGTSSFGGLSHRETLVALESLGLTADDVNIVEIGGQSNRIAALQAGSIAGGVVDSALRPDMEEAGFNILVKLSDLDTKTTNGALIVPRKFAEENPNTTLAIVAANLEAMQLMFEDTELAVDRLAEWAQMDRDEADQTLRQFLTVAQRDLKWTPEGNAQFHEFLQLQDPTVSEINPDDTYTFEFIDKLESLGLHKQLGVPGY